MIIAKTNPVETLGEHTNELLTRYETLKKSYKDDIEDDTVWKLLYLAVVYHDAGKAYTHFQKRMKSALGYHVQQTDFVHIPHNYLSPFFLPLNKIKLNRSEEHTSELQSRFGLVCRLLLEKKYLKQDRVVRRPLTYAEMKK